MHIIEAQQGYTAEETSGWICSWITQDRCKTSGHRSTSLIPKRAACLSKHTLLIKSSMSWRKRLITVDTITSRNTLNSQLDKSLELAAVTPLPECSLPRPAFQPFADTHSHFILWLSTSQNARAELLGEKGQIPPLGVLHAEADPAPLCAPAALPKAHGREQDRFGTSRFSILSLGLYWTQNSHWKPSQNHWLLPRFYSMASLNCSKPQVQKDFDTNL